MGEKFFNDPTVVYVFYFDAKEEDSCGKKGLRDFVGQCWGRIDGSTINKAQWAFLCGLLHVECADSKCDNLLDTGVRLLLDVREEKKGIDKGDLRRLWIYKDVDLYAAVLFFDVSGSTFSDPKKLDDCFKFSECEAIRRYWDAGQKCCDADKKNGSCANSLCGALRIVTDRRMCSYGDWKGPCQSDLDGLCSATQSASFGDGGDEIALAWSEVVNKQRLVNMPRLVKKLSEVGAEKYRWNQFDQVVAVSTSEKVEDVLSRALFGHGGLNRLPDLPLYFAHRWHLKNHDMLVRRLKDTNKEIADGVDWQDEQSVSVPTAVMLFQKLSGLISLLKKLEAGVDLHASIMEQMRNDLMGGVRRSPPHVFSKKTLFDVDDLIASHARMQAAFAITSAVSNREEYDGIELEQSKRFENRLQMVGVILSVVAVVELSQAYSGEYTDGRASVFSLPYSPTIVLCLCSILTWCTFVLVLGNTQKNTLRNTLVFLFLCVLVPLLVSFALNTAQGVVSQQ
jgi:hypothetical protein